MQTYRVDVYSECAFDKLSQCRVTMCYAISDDGKPFQYHTVCHSYHDGYKSCQKCILCLSLYIDKYGIPKERQVITPDMYPKK